MTSDVVMEPAVLITGASSGIGAGLAREFVRRGLRVALLARRTEQLETLAAELRAAGGKASAHRADVTVQGDVARAIAELAAQGITPNIVIANAGFGVVGKAQDLTDADYRRQFEALYPSLARDHHLPFVPFLLEGVGGNPALNQGDGLHPTAAGYQQVAALIWPVLRPVLQEAAR